MFRVDLPYCLSSTRAGDIVEGRLDKLSRLTFRAQTS